MDACLGVGRFKPNLGVRFNGDVHQIGMTLAAADSRATAFPTDLALLGTLPTTVLARFKREANLELIADQD